MSETRQERPYCTAAEATTWASAESIREAVRLMESIPKPKPIPQIIPSKAVPKFGRKWQFPSTFSRFVEYEEGDEEWAKPLGYGSYVEDPDTTVMFRVKMPLLAFEADAKEAEEVIYAHPDVGERVRQVLISRNEQRLLAELFPERPTR